MANVEALQHENASLRKELEVLRSQLKAGSLQSPSAAIQSAAANGACLSCPGVPLAVTEQQLPTATGTAAPQAVAAAGCSSSSSSSTQAYQAVHGLSKAQVERYSRQLLLPSFGIGAQGKLCHAGVLIVGCGGLGSPAALYLAAAGVGRLGLVDHDAVELSNMHRQISHTEDRLGMHKAQSTAAAVAALNSSVLVDTHLDGLQRSNAVYIVGQYDVVIDASDNAPTRYLINDACVACGVPLVSAAAVGTDGQLTVYNCGPSCPCYRCLFPECPAAANCSRCADAGVLGPVPGVMGVLQAVEAIKVVTGVGQPLAGKLLLYDALAGRFSTIKLRGRAPGCAACGEGGMSRADVASYDYAGFTGGQMAHDGPPAPLAVLPPHQRLTAQQAAQQLQSATTAAQAGGNRDNSTRQQHGSEALLLLDVRPAEQFAVMALPGAVNIPYVQLEQRLPEVLQLCGVGGALQQRQQQRQQQQTPTAGEGQVATAMVGPAADQEAGNGMSGSSPSSPDPKRIIVMCRRGNHSQLAVERLRLAGVCGAVDVVGGYEAWAATVDMDMPVL